MKAMFALLLVLGCSIYAQTITSKASGGSWNDANTWIGGSIPGEVNDVIIDGTVSVISGSSCNNLTVNAGGVLQNGGGLGWLALHAKGSCTNNGIIRNNPAGNSFQIVVWKNIINNGVWNCTDTYFPLQSEQTISQGQGKLFDTQVRFTDNSGYAYNTGSITAMTDLTFTRNIQMEGYAGALGYLWQTLNMNNHSLTLTADAYAFRGTVKNASSLYILQNACIADITFEGTTTIRGRGRIYNSNVSFKGEITIADTLQNCGGLGWLTAHFEGKLINNGVIKNNDGGNSLQVEAWGDVHNNGIWRNSNTFFPGKNNQTISQSTGKFFDTEIRLADAGGFGYSTGIVSAGTDLTFNKSFNMHSWNAELGDHWGIMDMKNNNIVLRGAATIYRGIIRNVNSISILEDSYIWDMSFEGNVTIKGRGRITNANVTFHNNVIVSDTLQNAGGLGWLAVHIQGSLTNNGVIKNNELGNSLHVEVFGDVHNNGVWRNSNTYLPCRDKQVLSQSMDKTFDTEVKFSEAGGWTYNTGSVTAGSDLTFTKAVNMHGYIAGTGDVWGAIDMNNKNLSLIKNASIFYGTVKNAKDLIILDKAYLQSVTIEGNTNIRGTGRIDNSNVVLRGTITVLDTLQNGGGLGWLTPQVYGELINHGIIRNNTAGNELHLAIHGNAYNYGMWQNGQTHIYTDGLERTIEGDFNTIFWIYKSGEPAGDKIIVESKFINSNTLYLSNGIEMLVKPGAEFVNKGGIGESGYVNNNGTFTSTHNLEWWSKLNPGLEAELTLIEKRNLVDVTATSFKNTTHPLMNSSIKQWLRVKGNGNSGNYKIKLHYNDELLNGNDENNLELYLSPDSGKTWKKISTPLNTTRDLVNNFISIGNDAYPLLPGFGDYILTSGGSIYVPSISAAIGGRSQIRVGPPNIYSVSYWNNGNQLTDQFAIVLNTNRGVHIKSIFSKEISSGKIIEIPVDSLTYGFRDEVVLLIEPLGPKEVRSFDVILTSEPDVNIEKTMAVEPITFTAVALWIGGAMLEEYISNTIVEGCYEMWRPVRHDKNLQDASIECVRNSMKKAVTVENGVKGIAKKGAEEIIKKTGRVAVWPVMLAKDMFDCLGNTIKGMKDYVNGNFDQQGKELVKVTSWDPNAKEGPGGYGAQGFMATAAPMTYTIFFENKKEATAAAYEIVIIDTLDSTVYDISSVEFGGMSHSMGTAVRDGNILTWHFVAIELPPNANPPEGEGWVKFTVRLKNDLPTGTQIKNRAVIKFDLNPWLATNVYVNTLDYDPPVSTPTVVYRIPGGKEVELIWENNDGTGAGVKNTMVYVANNDGPFTLAATVKGNFAHIPVEPNILYRFYTLSTDNVGNMQTSPVKTLEIMTGVKDENVIPEKFELEQNYPNPFNPSTTILFGLPEKGHVELKVFSVLGEEMVTLVNDVRDAGYYSVKWEAEGMAAGVYIYQIKFNGAVNSKKMMYLK